MNAPSDPALEEAVVAACVLSDKVLDRVVTDARLKAEHFWRPENAKLYSAVLSLAAAGETIDVQSLAAETRRMGNPVSPERIDGICGATPLPTSAPTHAKRLVELAYFRRLVQCSYELQAGVLEEDLDRIARAETLLARPEETVDSRSDPWQLADLAVAQLQKDGKDKVPLPFHRLNDRLGGGLTPGDLTYIGGHSSMGKSVLLDQIVSHGTTKTGLPAHVFINEMNREQRGLRLLAGISGVPFSSLNRGQSALAAGELDKVLDAAPNIPFGVTDCTGWSVDDICREIRWRNYGIVGVDIVHEIPHREVADLDHISRTLTQTARSGGISLIAAVHLNEKRVVSAVRPPPTLGDIRGSGMFQRQASNVIFVHREQDSETGDPNPDGAIWIAKARNGALGGLPVIFDERRMQFVVAQR